MIAGPCLKVPAEQEILSYLIPNPYRWTEMIAGPCLKVPAEQEILSCP